MVTPTSVQEQLAYHLIMNNEKRQSYMVSNRAATVIANI